MSSSPRYIIPKDSKVYMILGVLFLFLMLIFPRTGRFNYEYKKGSAWTYETLVAQFDFPIKKTEEQIASERENAGASNIRYFKYSEDVGIDAQKAMGAKNSLSQEMRLALLTKLKSIYDRGVIADGDVNAEKEVIFIQRGKRATKHPVSDVYTVSTARTALRGEFVQKFNDSPNPDSLLAVIGVMDLITPNLTYDQQTSEMVSARLADDISPTSGFVRAGQTIVHNGEIVTAEILQILDSYKSEYETTLGYTGPRFLLWLGNAMLSLFLVMIFFMTVLFTNGGIFSELNRLTYLCLVVAMGAAMALGFDRVGPYTLFLVPFPILAIYLLAFFRKSVILPVYMIAMLPLMIFCHNGTDLYVIYLAGGVTMMYTHDFFSRGWKQFIAAIILFAVQVLVFASFRLIHDVKGFSDFSPVVFLFAGSMMTVLLYPMVYLFERMFSLVSKNRLRELAETSNPLLLELSRKAPGTFQHTLQVCSLAEGAARELGCNVLLVKAGAMYHDIGKMENPMCFTENQVTEVDKSYHSALTSAQSAQLIIRHVSDGLTLADRHHLPPIIKAFISTHHGTTHTGYYYNMYMNAGGKKEDADTLFSYPGPAPTTKEQILLMICDSVEAASRSLRDTSPETISNMVEGIVATKTREGQLDGADISFRELSILKEYLKEQISKANHSRIAYPKLVKDPDKK